MSLDLVQSITGITLILGFLLCGTAGVYAQRTCRGRIMSLRNQHALSMFLTGLVFMHAAIARIVDGADSLSFFGPDNWFMFVIRLAATVSVTVSAYRAVMDHESPL